MLGLPVDLGDCAARAIADLQQRCGGQIVTLNAEMSLQAEKNSDLAAVIRSALLVIPDGSGVVLYLRLRGKKIRRCPGIELSEQLLQTLAAWGETDSAFFFGAAPGVAERAAAAWQQRLGVAIARSQHGYLGSPEEERRLLETLQERQPRLILVGLGVPRQEFWIAKHRHLCPNALWIGVGGSFDIWAGEKERAPQWLRDRHLEWLYRLYKEPWRWRRMLALPKFALRALLE